MLEDLLEGQPHAVRTALRRVMTWWPKDPPQTPQELYDRLFYMADEPPTPCASTGAAYRSRALKGLRATLGIPRHHRALNISANTHNATVLLGGRVLIHEPKHFRAGEREELAKELRRLADRIAS